MVLSLQKGFVRLRRLSFDDVPRLMAWDANPELFQLTGKKFERGDDATSWWGHLLRDRSRLIFAIVGDQGELIGDVELQQILWRSREAEVRISIGDKSYWDRGYGTEAMGEALAVAFDMLSLERVYLRVRIDNRRAIKSYLKAGFRAVARLEANGRLQGMTDLQLMEVTRQHHLRALKRA